jgi:hypothetical protein
MKYRPLIVVDDDSPEVRQNFLDVLANVDIEVFETWDKTKEFIVNHKDQVDAVVLDAKGKLFADEGESESHLLKSYGWVEILNIPFAIYTAYTDELSILQQPKNDGRVFSKDHFKAKDVIEYLLNEIALTPKLKLINKYPEPFTCFGGNYLDKKKARNVFIGHSYHF